jgi:hypothetical protein
MEARITKEGILEFKALVATKSIFKQMRTVNAEEYQEHCQLENIDNWNFLHWQGYVLDGESEQIYFIFRMGGTLCKIRGMDLFFLLRDRDTHPQPTIELRNLLPQIFIK